MPVTSGANDPQGGGMKKMASKDIGLWIQFLQWMQANLPTIYGAVLAFITAIIRIVYCGGGNARHVFVESTLCGALSLTLSSGLEHIGLSSSLAPFVGGMVGFIGVAKIKEFALRFISSKIPRGKDD